MSGGVEKHRGQGERNFKLRAPYLSVRDMRDIQISYKFVFVVRQKVNPLFYRLPRPWLKERHSLPSCVVRGLIEKHKSETWSEILDQLDQAEAASYDFGYKKARQELEEQIEFCYDQGYLQGVHEEKTRIHPALQAAHTLAWLVL